MIDTTKIAVGLLWSRKFKYLIIKLDDYVIKVIEKDKQLLLQHQTIESRTFRKISNHDECISEYETKCVTFVFIETYKT